VRQAVDASCRMGAITGSRGRTRRGTPGGSRAGNPDLRPVWAVL